MSAPRLMEEGWKENLSIQTHSHNKEGKSRGKSDDGFNRSFNSYNSALDLTRTGRHMSLLGSKRGDTESEVRSAGKDTTGMWSEKVHNNEEAYHDVDTWIDDIERQFAGINEMRREIQEIREKTKELEGLNRLIKRAMFFMVSNPVCL